MIEMRTNNNRRLDRDRLELPVSSWWIPLLTVVVAILAVVVALA
jgi:hypothetical protein